MQVDRLSESELKEILTIAQEGESKLKEMSDRLKFFKQLYSAIAFIPSLHQFETIIIKMTRSVLKLCQH
ncbi:hypothetical protein IQ255_30330 [Pleurocapsales cyanobacterium LEGE 10410]|nr:hypothetical protein [Pleurocapsales cyanobacterium LEGE 10410]